MYIDDEANERWGKEDRKWHEAWGWWESILTHLDGRNGDRGNVEMHGSHDLIYILSWSSALPHLMPSTQIHAKVSKVQKLHYMQCCNKCLISSLPLSPPPPLSSLQSPNPFLFVSWILILTRPAGLFLSSYCFYYFSNLFPLHISLSLLYLPAFFLLSECFIHHLCFTLF